jgi:hypothetical protein
MDIFGYVFQRIPKAYYFSFMTGPGFSLSLDVSISTIVLSLPFPALPTFPISELATQISDRLRAAMWGSSKGSKSCGKGKGKGRQNWNSPYSWNDSQDWHGGGKGYGTKGAASTGFSSTIESLNQTLGEIGSLGQLMSIGTQLSQITALGGSAPHCDAPATDAVGAAATNRFRGPLGRCGAISRRSFGQPSHPLRAGERIVDTVCDAHFGSFR